MISIDDIRTFEPDLFQLEEAAIRLDSSIVGWHVTAFDKFNLPLGSGVNREREIARTVALSETLERKLFDKFTEIPQRRQDFISHSSTCGMAFGFDLAKTKERSENEALERWAWSKWIDEKTPLPEVSHLKPNDRSEIFMALSRDFDRIRFFTKSDLRLKRKSEDHKTKSLFIVLAYKGNGVFPGSRVDLDIHSRGAWEHALVEAWRHLVEFRQMTKAPDEIINQRIWNFGNNGEMAESQIPEADHNQIEWQDAELGLQWDLFEPKLKGYLVRSLCENYLPWHRGSSTRFVY